MEKIVADDNGESRSAALADDVGLGAS
jgi:hypothetical protein